MWLFLLAAGGGAIGAGARYLVNVGCAACLGSTFPWATLGVNVSGSFLMGLMAALLPPGDGSAEWRTFLGTGILGGFTTFSAFSIEAWQLLERQQVALGAAYICASVVMAIAGLAAGLAAARALMS